MAARVREGARSPYLVAGVIAAIAGLLMFLVIHHAWIRPIWSILPAGLPIAVLGGLAVGWCYQEVHRGLPSRPWTALAFAGIILLILAPSAVLAEFRVPLLDTATFGVLPGQGLRVAARIVLDLLLPATVMGALAGWALGRSPRAAIATAVAGAAFALGPGHNIPLLGNTPSAGKGILLLLAITVVSALVLVEAVHWKAGK